MYNCVTVTRTSPSRIYAYMCTHATTGGYHFGSLGAACCRIGVTQCTYVVCKVYICKMYTRAVALRPSVRTHVCSLYMYVHMYEAVYRHAWMCVYVYMYVHTCISDMCIYICIRVCTYSYVYACTCTYKEVWPSVVDDSNRTNVSSRWLATS